VVNGIKMVKIPLLILFCKFGLILSNLAYR